MKRDNVLPIVCFFMSLLLLGLCYVVNEQEKIEIVGVDTILTTKIDTLWKDTAITKTKTKVKYVEKLRVDTLYTEKGDAVPLITENKIYQDTLCNEGDSVMLQIAISGVKSSLDSIKADWCKSTQIIVNTVTIDKYIKQPKKLLDRIHIQPQVTGGYDIINKQWGVTAGIGVGIDL